MSGDLYDRCIKHTRRVYPDGYGCAIIYLDDNLTPGILMDAADDVVLAAYSLKGREEGWNKDDDDLVRYIHARASSKRPEDWLIEGAQLVLQWANYSRPSISRSCQQALGMCGHLAWSK